MLAKDPRAAVAKPGAPGPYAGSHGATRRAIAAARAAAPGEWFAETPTLCWGGGPRW